MARIRISLGTFCFGSALLLAACGSARVVNRTQGGGVIALQGDRGKAMEQAHKEMAAHCGPGNYTIVQEGEVVVGKDTVAREDQDTYEHRDGTSSTAVASQSERDATEWRVSYQCGGGAAPPPGPAGPPPASAPPPGY